MIAPSAYRLPISHPEYRYPVSKNPYGAKLEVYRERIFCGNTGEGNRGQWRQQFLDSKSPASAETDLGEREIFPKKRREIHLEIGCNAGHVVVEWAKKNPEHAYIGMDWKFKPIYRAGEKAEKLGLKNILFLRGHAERLPHLFAPGEIDAFYLFFPDPWAKNSQQKNRFITSERLKEITTLLKPGGLIHIKTDHKEYFEWMLAAVKEAQIPWEILECTHNLHANRPDAHLLTMPEVTLFERIFIREGLPIHSLKMRTPLTLNQL